MTNHFNVTSNQKTLLIVLLLAIAVFAVYWEVQHFEFTNYDEHIYVTKNKNIQNGFTAGSIAYAFTDISTTNWHPLTLLSHMLDWTIFGDKAGGHHWTSVLIHIFNTILLFIFFKAATGTLWRSAFVAALFAVHPINVDSVAWIAERKNILCTFFWMAALVFYVSYCRAPSWKRYLPVFFSFALALMAKPMAVTLPFALLLLDYWPLNRTRWDSQIQVDGRSFKKASLSALVLEKIPLFILSAASMAITFYAARLGGTVYSMLALSFGQRLSNVLVSYAVYIKQMLWPFHLSAFYPYNYHIPLWQVVTASLLLIAATVVAIRCLKKFPYFPVGWFWYLGTLVPVIGLVQVGMQSMADRYAYIPFIGLFVILAWFIPDALKKWLSPNMLALPALGLIVFLIFVAHNQTRYWENSYTLYQNILRYAPKHYVPYQGLAIYMFEHERYREAAQYYRLAISFKKKDAVLHNSLGAVLERLGEKQEAEKEYREALRLDPKQTGAYNNLGFLLYRQGKDTEALQNLREAVKLEPALANAHYNIAKSLERKGLHKEAAFHYEVSGKGQPVSRGQK